jgi:hypothetical protein
VYLFISSPFSRSMSFREFWGSQVPKGSGAVVEVPMEKDRLNVSQVRRRRRAAAACALLQRGSSVFAASSVRRGMARRGGREPARPPPPGG